MHKNDGRRVTEHMNSPVHTGYQDPCKCFSRRGKSISLHGKCFLYPANIFFFFNFYGHNIDSISDFHFESKWDMVTMRGNTPDAGILNGETNNLIFEPTFDTKTGFGIKIVSRKMV